MRAVEKQRRFVEVKEGDLDEGVDGRLLYKNDETGGRS